jgi:acyl phosphate:glycerol-3-phosphate acyltransferase
VAAVLVLLGYLAGSVPWGVLLARRAGVDVRTRGSRNIGAANVARTAGAGLGALTLVADVAKGVVPALVARGVGAGPAVAAATGLAAFLGHLFPPSLRFAGGKGVATALGVLLVLAPVAAGAAIAVFALAFAIGRRVSVASLAGAIAAPLAIAVAPYPTPVLLAGLAMSALIVLRHRDNLVRLRAGREPRFALPKKRATPAEQAGDPPAR